MVSVCKPLQLHALFSKKTKAANQLLSKLSQTDHCYMGAFVDDLTVSGDMPLLTTVQDLNYYAQLSGHPVTIANFFQAFSYGGKVYPYPTQAMNEFKRYGAIPLVTLEPWDWDPKHPDHSRTLLHDILAGRWDAWLDDMALGFKDYRQPVLLRWAHEMNGDWYPWCGIANHDSAQTYIKTWRYVHRRMTRAGAHNVLWVFCPNSNSVPNTEWNKSIHYYPGDAYVDIIGVDTYNFGEPDERSFAKTIAEFDATYRQHWAKKPLIIPEIGVANAAKNPAQWITETFGSLKNTYPEIRAVLWFHMNDRKNQDFRIDQSAVMLTAYQQAIEVDYFSGTLP